jgi:hypothetical protein
VALYKYRNYLGLSKNPSFDLTFGPGHHVPCAGIFRCTGCGTEIALEGIGFFPDRDHHKHDLKQGAIGWRLVVATQASHPAPYLHGAA